jgi:membrane-bound lytic murein transglycosylase B
MKQGLPLRRGHAFVHRARAGLRRVPEGAARRRHRERHRARDAGCAFNGLTVDPSVLEASENQPEFETPVWDYLARLVDDKRVAEGRSMLEQWRRALSSAQRRFGVDRNFLVAVWGVETDYGRIMGRRPLVRSLATLSCNGPRQRYFRSELVATLQILQSGDVKPEAMRGSWAGAFGHSQFMPVHFPPRGGGSRWRRAPRHRGLGARCAGLHRQLS